MEALLEIMRRLRGPGGCPWDQEQTHDSLRRHLLEEAAEAVDAIASGDPRVMADELGDVLLQVLFHAEIAARRGAFDFQAVAESFVDKLRSRSPYLFDGSTGVVPAQEQERLWAKGKARERQIPPGR